MNRYGTMALLVASAAFAGGASAATITWGSVGPLANAGSVSNAGTVGGDATNTVNLNGPTQTVNGVGDEVYVGVLVECDAIAERADGFGQCFGHAETHIIGGHSPHP